MLFTLWFLSGISLLPIRLHKHSFQRCQTSSATPSCIFFLIPDVRKITLPKASVHKGKRRALQKSILFEQKKNPPCHTRWNFWNIRRTQLPFIPNSRPHAPSSFPHWLRCEAGTAFPIRLPHTPPVTRSPRPSLRYPVTGSVPKGCHPRSSRPRWVPAGYPGVCKGSRSHFSYP